MHIIRRYKIIINKTRNVFQINFKKQEKGKKKSCGQGDGSVTQALTVKAQRPEIEISVWILRCKKLT